jgi:hypothetical protein
MRRDEEGRGGGEEGQGGTRKDGWTRRDEEGQRRTRGKRRDEEEQEGGTRRDKEGQGKTGGVRGGPRRRQGGRRKREEVNTSLSTGQFFPKRIKNPFSSFTKGNRFPFSILIFLTSVFPPTEKIFPSTSPRAYGKKTCGSWGRANPEINFSFHPVAACEVTWAVTCTGNSKKELPEARVDRSAEIAEENFIPECFGSSRPARVIRLEGGEWRVLSDASWFV